MITCAQITLRSDLGMHIGDDPPLGELHLDQLWLDTYEVPNVLFRWNGYAWVKCGSDVDLDDYYTRVQLDTMFDQTREEISLRATREETNVLENRIETAEGKLTVQAGQITSAVSAANSALTNINNLRIGGRNYVLNSNQTLERSDASPDAKWMAGIAMSPDYLNDCKGKSIMFSLSYMYEDPQYGDDIPWIGFQIVYNVEGGSTTSRFWNWSHLFPAGSTKGWTRTQGTGTIPEDAISIASAMCTIQRGFASGLIRIRQPMVELSSKASDYSPAPEDDPNRLTVAESRITQNATNINLRVSQSIYDQDKIYRSATAPASPSVNMLWLNTAASPYVLSRWNGSSWITVGADKVIASGINITPNDITFRTTNLLFQLLDPANNENILMEMRANGLVGFKELYADNIVSPAIVPAYRLTDKLFISTVSIGNYYNVFFNVREACAFVNGKYIKEDVTISFWNQNAESIYDNEGIVIEGISGPGTLIISGQNANKTILSYVEINNCSAKIELKYLSIRDSRPRLGPSALHPALVYARHCSHVLINNCTLNCNNISYAAFMADFTTAAFVSSQVNNAECGFEVRFGMGSIESVKGNPRVAIESEAAIVFGLLQIPTGTLLRTHNGQIYTSGTTSNTGTTTPTYTPDQSVSLQATLTRSYAGLWRSDTNDLVQGVYSSNGYISSLSWNYGCMWFGTLRSILGGKTIKSATLTLKRKDGGTSGATALNLYGISNTGASGTCATTISHGKLGSINRGSTIMYSIPVSVVQRLANGTDGGLCFYETPYNFGRSTYSINYCRLSGTDGDVKPVLNVVYS